MSINKVPSLKELIKHLQEIPFIASRHLYRLTEHFLSMEEDKLILFCNKLQELRKNLSICNRCFCWKEKDTECIWCEYNRNKEVICVVETWIEALAIERTNAFKGAYHILGGTLSIIDGITPDKLNFIGLIDRIKNENVKEIIIAINQTPEADATSAYLERLINQKNIDIKISHLASGVRVGASLEFVDKLTMGKAFSFRR